MKAIYYPDVPFNALALPHIHREIYFDGIYHGLAGKTDLTILDIGANIGEVTRFMVPVARKIYAIEPSPLEFECLKMNKEYNSWDNVEVFNFAISDKDGEMGFDIHEGNRTANHLDPEGNIRVPTHRLDTFLAVNKIDFVDFMKLDVEGAEDRILTAEFPADKIKSLLVEFHDANDWKKLSGVLVKLGYRMRQLTTQAIVCWYSR